MDEHNTKAAWSEVTPLPEMMALHVRQCLAEARVCLTADELLAKLRADVTIPYAAEIDIQDVRQGLLRLRARKQAMAGDVGSDRPLYRLREADEPFRDC